LHAQELLESQKKDEINSLQQSFFDMHDQLPVCFHFDTTRGKEGAGLGLSVSYSIIKKHGGDILIDSEPNIGLTVALALPI
jgi:K+-sensing histidine kinase KdpD